MPFTDGGPMYCLMSALSTNAKSIFSVMFDVVRITTLECLEHEVKKKTNKINTHKGLTDRLSIRITTLDKRD